MRHALARAPEDVTTYGGLAEHLLRKQWLDLAAAVARRGTRLAPQDLLSGCVLGEALLGSGHPREAAHVFAQTQAHHPTDERVVAGAVRSSLIYSLAYLARTAGAPQGIAVRGPFRDTSGYSVVVRSFLRHWLDSGERVILAGKMWGPELDEGKRDPELDGLNQPVFAETAIHFDVPDEVLPVPGMRNINLSMTETSRVPYDWVVRARWHDRLIVPTQSSWNAWAASGMPSDSMRLCPLGCDVPDQHLTAEPPFLVTPSGRPVTAHRFRFINISSGTTRKNIGGLIRAWARATRPHDDAVLVLKLGKGDKQEILEAYFKEILEINSLQRAEMAEIVLVFDKFGDAEISGMLRECSHYISMSYGEGWDLPMGNAGFLGLSLIAPEHSAYLSYLNASIAHFIPSRPVPVPGANTLASEWWEPDEAAAAAVIRRIIDGDEPAKMSARNHLSTHFRWKDAARRLLALSRDDR